MGKQIWKPGTVLYPMPLAMISCGTMEKSNIVTVAWTGIVNTNPAMTYVSIRPSRFSYDIIKNSGEFVINLVNRDLIYACDYCGVKSGRDVDKFKEMNLTARKGNIVDAPIIYESAINIECKVKEILPLGSHHMFLADVVSVNASDEYFDEAGKFHFNKSDPVCYSHGAYYTLGEKVGSFGYSVKKKPTTKTQKKITTNHTAPKSADKKRRS